MTFSEFVEALKQKQLKDEREGRIKSSPKSDPQLDKMIAAYKKEMQNS
jgi:hypothetical protein